MKVRFKDSKAEGDATRFNMHAMSEIIVGFKDGDQDTMFIKDFDVFIEAKGIWLDMYAAFSAKDIITDNYNAWFGEPKEQADRDRGYFLS